MALNSLGRCGTIIVAKGNRAFCFLALYVLGVAPIFVQPTMGQEGAGAAARFATGEFSLSSTEDLSALLQRRDKAIDASIAALDKYRRGEFARDADEPERAIEVLHMFRTTRREALAALCDNLDYKPVIGGEPGPLNDFPAANALIAVGGAPACSALFRSLRRPLDRRTQLLHAHVFAAMDSLAVTNVRIRERIAWLDSGSGDDTAAIGATERKNLEQILEWINTKDFQRKVELWPASVPAPRRQPSKEPIQ